MAEKKGSCCDMHKKVALQIAKVYSEVECGVSDATLADFHDFAYKPEHDLPVAAALSFRFCPWCGTAKDHNDQSRRRTEVVKLKPLQ